MFHRRSLDLAARYHDVHARPGQVILTVVKRKDLEDGSVPAKDREKHFPLTTDEQNLRMVELMSLGVDLPQEKLLALLR